MTESTERTETDDRVAENQSPAPIASLTRKPDGEIDPSDGIAAWAARRRCEPARPGRTARSASREAAGLDVETTRIVDRY